MPASPTSPDRLRVLVVNQTAATSGAEHSLLTLLAALPRAIEVTLASPPGRLSALALEAGAAAHVPISGTEASFRLHPRTTPPELAGLARSSWQVASAARRRRVHLVHANTTRAGLIAIGARSFGAPAPLVHVRDWAPPSRAGDLVLGAVARGAGAIVANSQHVADQFGRVGAAQLPHVIHNPVDLARFNPARHDRAASRAAFGLPASAPLLGVVGQLTPWKGQDDAIRALAEVRRSVPDAQLVIAGSAKFAGVAARFDNAAFAAGLPDLAAELGVGDAVHLLGEVDDVPAVLAALDVQLVPSWEEAFGRVVVEGMALGLPVLATAVGGPPEIIRDGDDGLILAPREPQHWGQVAAALLTDAPRRAALGAAAQRSAQRFAPPAHAEAIIARYRALAS